MKQTDIKSTLGKEDVIDLIGQQWMLVTAGTKDSYNTMTASWGGIGYLWNKPVAFVFIRPERYTHDFIESQERMTLSFYPEKFRWYGVHGGLHDVYVIEIEKVYE